METRVGRRLSETRPNAVETVAHRSVPTLVGLALEFPVKMAGGVVNLFQPGSSPRGRDGVRIGPMSYDWVRQCSVDADKHGDLP